MPPSPPIIHIDDSDDDSASGMAEASQPVFNKANTPPNAQCLDPFDPANANLQQPEANEGPEEPDEEQMVAEPVDEQMAEAPIEEPMAEEPADEPMTEEPVEEPTVEEHIEHSAATNPIAEQTMKQDLQKTFHKQLLLVSPIPAESTPG